MHVWIFFPHVSIKIQYKFYHVHDKNQFSQAGEENQFEALCIQKWTIRSKRNSECARNLTLSCAFNADV